MNDTIPPPARPANRPSENKIVDSLLALRSAWPLAIVLIALGTIVGVVMAKLTPPVYEAIATVEFDADAAGMLVDKRDPVGNYLALVQSQAAAETQYKIMVSDQVLSRVVVDLRLNSDSAFLGVKGPVVQPIAPVKAAAILRSYVRVEAVKNTRLFTVRVEYGDPRRARQFCDAIVAAYMAQSSERLTSATNTAVTWLNGQVDRSRGDLEDTENQLHAFKKRMGLPSLSINDASSMAHVEMQAYGDALTKTRTEKAIAMAKLAELRKVSDGDFDTLPDGLGGQGASSLRQRYLEADSQRRLLVVDGKGENHPALQRANEQLQALRDALIDEARRVRARAEREFAVLARQEAEEALLYEQARQQAVDLNMKQIEYHRLDRTREQSEKLYSNLLERAQQADLARLMGVSGIRLLDAAVEPEAPLRPRPTMYAGVGMILGLALTITLVVIRGLLDSTIRSTEDIEERLGMTSLGALPRVPGQGGRRRKRATVATGVTAPELAVHEHPLSSLAEAARALRTNLTFLTPDRPWRTLLVTSATAQEGKTTVACTLAVTLVQSGKRVCVVDCDLRRPRLHRVFGCSGAQGITNVLVGQATLTEVTHATGIEGLHCLPAGPLPPSPADLLQSTRFRQVLADLTATYDCVILDSPPAAVVTDAAVMSATVDGTVFVARSRVVSVRDCLRGLRALSDVNARILGVVLNCITSGDGGYRYTYYQGQTTDRPPPPPPPGPATPEPTEVVGDDATRVPAH